MRSCYETTKDISLIANRLYFPLSADDRDVNLILGALTFEREAMAPIAGAWGEAARLAESHVELVNVEA
jgi:hypothetical protein